MQRDITGREAEAKTPDTAERSSMPNQHRASKSSHSAEEAYSAGRLPERASPGKPRIQGESYSEEKVLAPTPPSVTLDEPYAQTVVTQLAGTVACDAPPSTFDQVLLDDAVAAYKLMDPADPADSALCRFIVALANTGMDSLKRATAATGLPLSQERDLKLGMKAAITLAELIKVFDGRRGRKSPHVSVGQVNVQSGGQAIVGNVSHRKDDKRASGSFDGEDDAEEAA